MISRIRVISLFLVMLMILPFFSIATPPGLTTILGVTIHLKNNEKLDGYIEANVYMNSCNEKDDPYNDTFKQYLEGGGKISSLSDGRDTIRFINKLIDIQYGKVSRPVTTKSNLKVIKMDDIKSIESVCRKWDGRKNDSGIPIITDYMAKYISNRKIIAFYLYSDEDRAKDTKENCELCACSTTYISYNPKYTGENLEKLRQKIYEMPTDVLENEGLIRFTECWD